MLFFTQLVMRRRTVEGSQITWIVFVPCERSGPKTLERDLRILRSFDRPAPPMFAGCACSESCGGFGGSAF
jgi:hypothetical protein